MQRGSEAGPYLRFIDFVYHSTLGLRVIKKKKKDPDLDLRARRPPASFSIRGSSSNRTEFRLYLVDLTEFRVRRTEFRVRKPRIQVEFRLYLVDLTPRIQVAVPRKSRIPKSGLSVVQSQLSGI